METLDNIKKHKMIVGLISKPQRNVCQLKALLDNKNLHLTYSNNEEEIEVFVNKDDYDKLKKLT